MDKNNQLGYSETVSEQETHEALGKLAAEFSRTRQELVLLMNRARQIGQTLGQLSTFLAGQLEQNPTINGDRWLNDGVGFAKSSLKDLPTKAELIELVGKIVEAAAAKDRLVRDLKDAGLEVKS